MRTMCAHAAISVYTGQSPKRNIERIMISTPDIENTNVSSFAAMPTPVELHATLPVSDAAFATVMAGRATLRNILDRKDDRLFVVVGPCSIHDPEAGLD